MNKTNIPVISFLARNVALLVCFVLALALFKWEAAFQAAGPLVYLPVLFVEAMLAALLVRHFFWRKSIDDYARIGGFQIDWFNELSKAERVRWTLGVTLWLIFCASLIAAAIAK